MNDPNAYHDEESESSEDNRIMPWYFLGHITERRRNLQRRLREAWDIARGANVPEPIYYPDGADVDDIDPFHEDYANFCDAILRNDSGEVLSLLHMFKQYDTYSINDVRRYEKDESECTALMKATQYGNPIAA